MQIDFFSYKSIDSTNSEAEKLINKSQSNYFIITAESQTNGIGRGGSSWQSSLFGNIYATIGIKCDLIPSEVSKIIPLYAAFAIQNSINSSIIQYKWPNDLLIENKKFCGILVKKYLNYYIIGFGVNVKHSPQLNTATCLNEHNLDLDIFRIINSFEDNLHINSSSIIKQLSNSFFTRGEVTINKGEFVGFFESILQNGSLVLMQNKDRKVLTFGEVDINI